MRRPQASSFASILEEAVAYFTEHGFASESKLDEYTQRLRHAAEREASNSARVEQMLRNGLGQVYKRATSARSIGRHVGVGKYAIERLRPTMRAELERRIRVSADLIVLNRRQTIEKTLQRFAGWISSVPKGGSRVVKKREVKSDIRKPLASLPFVERRVLIDQGHKLAASINETIARENQALAIKWRSHWKEANYDYRPDHKARDGKVYALRGNWALQRGLMKPGKVGYYEDISAVGEEVFCRCYGTYIYNLQSLPPEMLTKKGSEEIEKAKAVAEAL